MQSRIRCNNSILQSCFQFATGDDVVLKLVSDGENKRLIAVKKTDNLDFFETIAKVFRLGGYRLAGIADYIATLGDEIDVVAAKCKLQQKIKKYNGKWYRQLFTCLQIRTVFNIQEESKKSAFNKVIKQMKNATLSATTFKDIEPIEAWVKNFPSDDFSAESQEIKELLDLADLLSKKKEILAMNYTNISGDNLIHLLNCLDQPLKERLRALLQDIPVEYHELPCVKNQIELINDVIQQSSVEFQNTVQQGCGIQNGGNSCYLNASIQALRFTNILSGQQNRGENELKKKIIEIASKLRTSLVSANEINDLRNDIIKNHLQHFGAYTQEDAHELCVALLDIIEAPLIQFYEKNTEEYKKGYKVEAAYRNDSVSIIDLTVNEGSISQCIAQEKSFSPNNLPEFLPISLRRYTARQNLVTNEFVLEKTTHDVPLERVIRVPLSSQQGIPNENQFAEYELVSSIIHRGATPREGHYYTYVLNSEGDFVRYDDSRVYKQNFQETVADIERNGYIYFYRLKRN